MCAVAERFGRGPAAAAKCKGPPGYRVRCTIPVDYCYVIALYQVRPVLDYLDRRHCVSPCVICMRQTSQPGRHVGPPRGSKNNRDARSLHPMARQVRGDMSFCVSDAQWGHNRPRRSQSRTTGFGASVHDTLTESSVLRLIGRKDLRHFGRDITVSISRFSMRAWSRAPSRMAASAPLITAAMKRESSIALFSARSRSR
jgi:hypothetical protein